jgi:peptide/nickel transport system substrate-binding protein
MNFGYLAMNCDRAPFDNPKVRRAVAHAVNKAKVLELAVFGFGKTGPNPMPPSVPGYHDGIRDYAYDPEKAKALLREAGYTDGFETDLWAMTLARPYMPRPTEVAEILKEDLKAVGIRARIVTLPWAAYLEKIENGEHPICLAGWTADNGDPDNFLWQLLSKENAKKGAAQNVAFYRNEEVSALLDRAKHVVDEKERMALYRKAQEIIHEDCPVITLLYLPQMIAYRKEVKGFPLHPLGIVKLGKVRMDNR